MLRDDCADIALSLGRYFAFGIIALIPAALAWHNMQAISRLDWIEALKLALIGNLAYYVLLARAIRKEGVLLPMIIIGTSSVVIAVCSNWLSGQAADAIAWRRLTVIIKIHSRR